MEDDLVDGNLVMELERTSEINRFFDMRISDVSTIDRRSTRPINNNSDKTPDSLVSTSFLGKRPWTELLIEKDIPRGTPDTPTKALIASSNVTSLASFHGTTQEELFGELTRLMSQDDEVGDEGSIILAEEFSAPSGLFSLSLESPSIANTSNNKFIMSTPIQETIKQESDYSVKNELLFEEKKQKSTATSPIMKTPNIAPRSALRSAPNSSTSKKVQFAPLKTIPTGTLLVRRSPRLLQQKKCTPVVSSPLCSQILSTPSTPTKCTLDHSNSMLVWARWRPTWYAPAVLMKRASRTREIWKIKFCHWTEDRKVVGISASDLVLCSLNSLRLNDQIFVVRNRAGQTFESVKFKGWINETNLLVLGEVGEEVIELNRIIITRQLFGVISRSRVESIGSRDTLTPPLISSSNKSETSPETSTIVDHCSKSRNGIFEGFIFWITLGSSNIKSLKQKSAIKRSLIYKIGLGGGTVLIEEDERVEYLLERKRKIILISDGLCRTTKSFISIILKYPIVNIKWIDECLECGRLMPFKPHLLPLKLRNEQILNERFLVDWSITLEGSFKFISAWKLFLQIAGATIYHPHYTLPSSGNRMILVERPSSVPASITRWATQRKILIQGADFIIDQILLE